MQNFMWKRPYENQVILAQDDYSFESIPSKKFV